MGSLYLSSRHTIVDYMYLDTENTLLCLTRPYQAASSLDHKILNLQLEQRYKSFRFDSFSLSFCSSGKLPEEKVWKDRREATVLPWPH